MAYARPHNSKERDADRLDLMMFRLVTEAERFSDDYKDNAIGALARQVSSLRSIVRRHMSEADRKATEGQ